MRITKEDIDRIYSDLVISEDADGTLAHLVELFEARDASAIVVKPFESKICGCFLSDDHKASPGYVSLEHQKALFELAAADGISSVFTDDLLGNEYPPIHASMLGMHFKFDDFLIAVGIYRNSSVSFTNSDVETARELLPHLERAVMLIHQKQEAPINDANFLDKYGLTKREVEIIEHLMKGLSYPQIQSVLDISHNTLKWHTKNIYQKMQVSTLPALLSMVFNGKKF